MAISYSRTLYSSRKPFAWRLISRRSHSSTESKKYVSDPSKIFKIISNCPKLGLETILNQNGIRVSTEVVEEVLRQFQNAGLLAYQFFQWAGKQNSYSHTVLAYHTMIDSLSRVRQYTIMWDLVSEMKKKNLLNVETFCIIMKRYARAHKIEETVYTFNSMEKHGVNPNLAAFNGLLSSLCKSRNAIRAHEIFQSMKGKFTPNSKTYTILLEGWGRAMNLPKARMVFREMVESGCRPDIVTCGIMVDILCKAGRVNEAVSLVKEMGRVGSCNPTSLIYSVLIRTYGKENRVGDAVRVFSEMEADVDVVAYNAIVGVFCGGGKFGEVYRVLEEMKEKGICPNSRTCNIVLNALIKRKETGEAVKVFQEMVKVCEPDGDSYTIMIKMFCEKKEVGMAVEMWKYMKRKRFVPSMHTFSVLINGLCESGDVAMASGLFEEMIEKGIQPCGVTVGRLRQLLIKEGKAEVFEFLKGKMNLLVTDPLV